MKILKIYLISLIHSHTHSLSLRYIYFNMHIENANAENINENGLVGGSWAAE